MPQIAPRAAVRSRLTPAARRLPAACAPKVQGSVRHDGGCRYRYEVNRNAQDAPAHVGCLIEVRLVGVISAEQIEDRNKQTNDRLLGIAIHSYDHEDITTIDDVSKTLLSQLEEFFVSYNKQRGKKFRITGTGGPIKAIRLLKHGIKKQKDAKKK